MSWRQAVSLAGKELRRRTGRAVLTVLAVALAAALLTALLTIANTAETKVLDELAKGGPLSGIRVSAAKPDAAQVGQDDAKGGPATVLDQAAIDRIRSLPSVRDVVPVSVVRSIVVVDMARRDGSRLASFADNIVGVDIRNVPNLPVTVLAGRLPAPGSTNEVTVNEGFLERLGFRRPDASVVVGSALSLGTTQAGRVGDRLIESQRWTRATVIGVVAQEAGEGQMLASIELTESARRFASQPVSLDGRAAPVAVNLASPFAGAFVVADSIDNVGRVRSEISALGFASSAPENLIASVERYLTVVGIVLTSVGLIALAVAAIGITNATLAAVRERRRDIGVLKAIGATDRDIRRIFLVESGSLGAIGGVLGAALGYAVAVAVGTVVNRYLVDQGFEAVPVTMPIATIVGAVVGSTVLAVIAGILPAARASRLSAREAMGSL